jgi:hypothetical protein
MHNANSSPNVGDETHAQVESAHEAAEAGRDGVFAWDHMRRWRAGGLPWWNGIDSDRKM